MISRFALSDTLYIVNKGLANSRPQQGCHLQTLPGREELTQSQSQEGSVKTNPGIS